MEHSSQSSDRWQNSCQCCAGPPLRSLSASGTPCIDGLGRAKQLLLSAYIDRAERPPRTNLCINGNLAGLEPCCSRSISPATGASVLTSGPGFQCCHFSLRRRGTLTDGHRELGHVASRGGKADRCYGVGLNMGVKVGIGVALGVAVPEGVGLITTGGGVSSPPPPSLGSFL